MKLSIKHLTEKVNFKGRPCKSADVKKMLKHYGIFGENRQGHYTPYPVYIRDGWFAIQRIYKPGVPGVNKESLHLTPKGIATLKTLLPLISLGQWDIVDS